MTAEGEPRHSILLVEDNREIRDTVATLLESEGYRVFRAENGEHGMEVLKTMPRPCLILLDMMMPVLDGHGFMKLLQADEALISIPVVVVSAVPGHVPDQVMGFLRKPFDLNALIDIVNEHCA